MEPKHKGVSVSIDLFEAVLLVCCLLILHSPQTAGVTRASTWEYCGCHWGTWKAWSDCTKLCYGRQVRTRSVWGKFHSKKGCETFQDCADIGSEYQTCNKDCNHGYYLKGYPCKCSDGWEGRCCDSVVRCGSPGRIANGRVSGSSYNYDDTVTYYCNQYYNISGYNKQTCSKWGLWGGTKPRCIFVNTCASNPCQNSGTCVDGLDEYTCRCRNGYSGVHCEHDIQPPVFTNCPRGFSVNATSATVNVTWEIPQASDPHGHPVTIFTNYPLGYAEFPWDDFTVQYVATKHYNGLRSECKFDISVRPTPCPGLNVPVNGAKLCNGWKTDMAGLCRVFCKGDNSLPFGYDLRQWWVCGAHGAWIPGGLMPNCSAQPVIENGGEWFDFREYQFNDCSNDKKRIRKTYVEKLQESEFKYFCDKNKKQCVPENVDVQCG